MRLADARPAAVEAATATARQPVEGWTHLWAGKRTPCAARTDSLEGRSGMARVAQAGRYSNHLDQVDKRLNGRSTIPCRATEVVQRGIRPPDKRATGLNLKAQKPGLMGCPSWLPVERALRSWPPPRRG
jgi:hypothetical protein